MKLILTSYAMRRKEINNVYCFDYNKSKEQLLVHCEGADYWKPIVIDMRKYKYMTIV